MLFSGPRIVASSTMHRLNCWSEVASAEFAEWFAFCMPILIYTRLLN